MNLFLKLRKSGTMLFISAEKDISMEHISNSRRKSERKILDPMGIGVLHLGDEKLVAEGPNGFEKKVCYIDIMNKSDEGFCFRTSISLNADVLKHTR